MKNDTTSTWNARLKEMREKTGLSQRKFCAGIDMNHAQYSYYERGSSPSLPAFVRICDGLEAMLPGRKRTARIAVEILLG